MNMDKKRSTKIPIIALFFLLFTALNSFGAMSSLEIEEQYLAQGKTMIEFGRYDDAIRMFDTAIKMNPNSVDAYVGKGMCYELLNNKEEMERMYYKAKELDPNAIIPDVAKYRDLDKQRKSSTTQDLKDKLAKEKTAKIDALPNTANPQFTVEQTADGRYTVKEEGVPVPKGDMLPSIQSRQDVQYWHRGGFARTGALGEIEHVLPDASTAMDSYAMGIEAGSLFRKVVHHFNLNPSIRSYKNTLGIRPGRKVNTESMMFSLEGTRGESVWPNQTFFNGMVPYFISTYKKSSDIDNPPSPDMTDNNSGMLFGGKYFAGIKPTQQLAIAGSFGYEYGPFHEAINTLDRQVMARSLHWQVGAAGYFPQVATNNDELDVAASFGSYNPPKKLFRLSNGEWLGLPYSLFNGYSLLKTDILNTYDSGYGDVTEKDSQLFEATGFEAKASVHYMYGDGLHEAFVYFGVPVGVKYTLEHQYEVTAAGSPVSLLNTVDPKIDLGTASGFSFAAGTRNDIVIVSPGIKYEFNYFANDFTEVYGPYSGKETTVSHRITGGFNLTPVRIVAVPVEFVYGFKSVENSVVTEFTTDMIARMGVEARPIPQLALRAGFSYEQQKTSYKSDTLSVPESGSEANPYMNWLGAHFGAGVEMQAFEVNLSGIIKDIYPTPEYAGVDSGSTSYFAIIADINLYM